jgi:cysteinyl-tRNA synthetase
MKTEDAEALIEVVNKIQASFETTLTQEELAAKVTREYDDTSSSLVYSADQREAAFDDFATLAAIDALQTLADEMHAVIQARKDKLYHDCLEVYYALEELLAKDPENPNYMKHVNEMQRAHLSQYGKAIPGRGV